MKGRRKAAFAVTLAAALLPGPGAASASSHDQAWRQDITALHDTLPLRHPNLFFHVTKQAWNSAVAELDASVPSLQDYEVVVGLMKVVAMIGDAHTAIRVSSAGFRSYPLLFTPFADGLHVTGATQETAAALGARLVGIGETAVEDAIAAVGAIVPHENDPWLRAQSPPWLATAEVLAALHLAPDAEHASFVLEGPGGRSTLDLSPIPLGTSLTLFVPDPGAVPPPAYRRNLNLNYWFEYEPDTRTLLFEYNACVPMPNPTPEKFSQSLLDAANANPVARVVVDLRNNGGGDSSLMARLLAGLHTRSDLLAPGSFFGIIGNRTFSSGVWGAVDLRRDGGILYGEATGGKPNGYGNVTTFALPNSGFLVFYSTRYFQIVGGDPPSVDPDVVVPISFGQYLAGRDPVLDAITGGRSLVRPPPRRPHPAALPPR